MRKKLILSFACLTTLSVFGQEANERDLLKSVNWDEDSTEITTISDIAKMQQDVTNKKQTESHYRNVWSRKGYLNLGYNSTTLDPDQRIETGVDGGIVAKFKSNWGASLQVGRSYALHKTPIANKLQFNLDYTYIDLNVNHFEHEGNGKNLYNSNTYLYADDSTKYYTPWNLEKYDINYGMAIGPSISIAPFTSTSYSGLHYLKLNVYFHIGYHVSFLYIKNDEEADISQKTDTPYKEQTYEEKTVSTRHDRMKDNLKLDLGHGLTKSFGLSLTWKFIGVGYEHRSANLKYQSLSTNDFGSDTYKFKSSTNRVFIQFRL